MQRIKIIPQTKIQITSSVAHLVSRLLEGDDHPESFIENSDVSSFEGAGGSLITLRIRFGNTQCSVISRWEVGCAMKKKKIDPSAELPPYSQAGCETRGEIRRRVKLLEKVNK